MFLPPIPKEVFDIAVEHYQKTGIVPEFLYLDTCEWQLRCPIPEDDCFSYNVNWKPDKPTKFFFGESYAGSYSSLIKWKGVDRALELTRFDLTKLDED